MGFRVLGVALLVLSINQSVRAETTDLAPLRALLGVEHAKPAPGCVLGVFRDGKLDAWTAAGDAQLSGAVPLTDQSVFYAASISKQFTALAAVQLHLAGKLDLDADVRTWLPEMHAHETPISVRMLLNHTSGVLDSMALRKLAGGASTSENSWHDLISQPTLNFSPGTSAFYSNGGYTILARLVEKASGKGFADYIQTNILDPIGMRDTYMLHGDHRPSPHLAYGYTPIDNGYAERKIFPRSGGAGGLMLTLRDLERYEYDIEHGHKVWTPQVRALMETPGQLKNGKPAQAVDRPGQLKYALGLMINDKDGRRLVQHGGILEGFQHMYMRSPADQTAVAVLCNDGSSPSAHKARAALDLLLGPAPATLADAPVNGVYRARTLPTRYVVSRSDKDRLTLAILADGKETPNEVIELQRDGESGGFKGGGVYVNAEGNDGLVIGTDRAKGLRAVRQQP